MFAVFYFSCFTEVYVICAPVLTEGTDKCSKTKTIVITLANHKGHRQFSEPIKIQNLSDVVDAKRWNTHACESQLLLVLLLTGLKNGALS